MLSEKLAQYSGSTLALIALELVQLIAIFHANNTTTLQ